MDTSSVNFWAIMSFLFSAIVLILVILYGAGCMRCPLWSTGQERTPNRRSSCSSRRTPSRNQSGDRRNSVRSVRLPMCAACGVNVIEIQPPTACLGRNDVDDGWKDGAVEVQEYKSSKQSTTNIHMTIGQGTLRFSDSDPGYLDDTGTSYSPSLSLASTREAEYKTSVPLSIVERPRKNLAV